MIDYTEVLEILRTMSNSGDIKEAAVISREGILIRAIPENIDRMKFAAKAAIVLGAAETALSELGLGRPDRIIVEAGNGRIIVMGAGPRMLLVAMIENKIKTGSTLLAMEKAAEKIKLIS